MLIVMSSERNSALSVLVASLYGGLFTMSWRSGVSKVVKELRFQFCQTSPSSKGMRYGPELPSIRRAGAVLVS